jgi:acyl-CoA hydrolase
MPTICSIDRAVEEVLERLPAHIHMGMPLGLGKANRFANALYARIQQLPDRQLTIYTALALGRPTLGDGLQKRFLEPFVERVYGDYLELDFLHALRTDTLPANVKVEQFFMQPGSLLHSNEAQQNYVSSNYSHAARDINAKGLNLVAQLVAQDQDNPSKLSLSCNPDITLDLLPMIAKRRAAGETVLMLGQIHDQLPYMDGGAEVPSDTFDLLIDVSEYTRLFSTPNMPVSCQDHFIGLHSSTLVRDGGTLQIGIGAMGDALTAALLARQADNNGYRAVLDDLDMRPWQSLIDREGGLQPFATGLYGCSEMFVHGLLVLAEAGVMRRKVYPDVQQQTLANLGTLDESTPGGVVLHGGFFLGPQSFYERLRELPKDTLSTFDTVFTVTLLGAAVSDQLESGRVLSGVGGQYNFVVQGHALEDARSVLVLRSWRESAGVVSSNVQWDYGHCTIPRHLRDIVITEYGIADLRGQTDAVVVERLINIADSRFQASLIAEAQIAGKLRQDFQLDPRFTDNTPERLQAIRERHPRLFAEYPLGCDFTEEERDLLRALNWLKSKFHLSEIFELGKAALDAPEPSRFAAHLQRMQLSEPHGLREDLYQRLLLAALQATQS